MSNALVCDNCGDKLALDRKGDDENGEVSGWLIVQVRSGETWDACTRSCATELLSDDGPVRPVVDEWAQVISDIARTIREDRESDHNPDTKES